MNNMINLFTKTRTAGDGREADESTSEIKKSDISENLVTKAVPGRLIQLFPSKTCKIEKKSFTHSKSLKFVPYEPYPAAVKPIFTHSSSRHTKKSRNDMDINTLISQMSQMNRSLNEFKPKTKVTALSDKCAIEYSQEKEHMRKKIDNLLYENGTLKEQLKQQVQVNKELKTMLVASMGEDLETQVQSLNDDKKLLANALLNSAQHLSTHQEQTEWLAGQCEVWRSKFLASSLMVEELASWKKELSTKTDRLEQAIKLILEERHRVRDMLLCMYRNLYSLHERWLEDIALSESIGNKNLYNRPIGNLNMLSTMPHSTNIIDMASVNLKLSENISGSVDKHDIDHLTKLPSDTDGEQNAERAMSMEINIKSVNEEPMNALVHHAYTNSANNERPAASCIHCNGKVQLL